MKIFPKDGYIRLSRSPHGPHIIISNLIKTNTSVLDLGCNVGILGKLLKNNKNNIDGVDINIKAISRAKKYYQNLYIRDLSQKLILKKQKYDFIVLSDILEHLPQPDQLLQDCKKLLKPDGKIIVSLPNIARLEIRLKLLFGKFEYLPGIMSPDHLRHFTFNSGKKLLNNCGYKVIKIIPTGFGHMIKIFPTIFAFQFIYICSLNKK